jgi:hypothetical protein
MTKDRFEELEKRNKNNQMQLCYELFCEEKQQLPLEQFNHLFEVWFSMISNYSSLSECITYFKMNKIT